LEQFWLDTLPDFKVTHKGLDNRTDMCTSHDLLPVNARYVDIINCWHDEWFTCSYAVNFAVVTNTECLVMLKVTLDNFVTE